MLAAWYERLGAAREVLQVSEMPDPEAGPGEVRVRLRASGINPADVKRRAGVNYKMEHPLVIPNSDGAGEVDQVGAGVPDWWLGRRVWLYNGQRGGRALGTAAEYIALDVDLVTPLPDDTPFDAGACLGIPAMTAHRCLFADGPIVGKTVLVTGGAGAVGHYAVQLAAWGGAKVIATARGIEKTSDAKQAGAFQVLNYRGVDLADAVMDATQGRGVDRVVEVDFGGNLKGTLGCLADHGVIAGYATDGDPAAPLPFREMMRRNARILGVMLNTVPLAQRQAAQRDINRWLDTGKPIHRIAGDFPLRDIAAAHEAVEAGGKRGTVIVTP